MPEQVALSDIHIDDGLVRSMEKFFKKFKGAKKDVLDEEGPEFDVEAYIDEYKKYDKECMTRVDEKQGLDIVIAYDQSGSMNGHRIQIVREMVATLLKATQKNPKINVMGIGWQGYDDVTAEKITDWKDCTRIYTAGTTPLTEAVILANDILMKMNGNKKLLFVLTDGSPNGSAKTKFAHQVISRMQRKKNTAIGIVIGYGDSQAMNEIFGKSNSVSFDDTMDMAKFIKKKVQKTIVRYLK